MKATGSDLLSCLLLEDDIYCHFINKGSKKRKKEKRKLRMLFDFYRLYIKYKMDDESKAVWFTCLSLHLRLGISYFLHVEIINVPSDNASSRFVWSLGPFSGFLLNITPPESYVSSYSSRSTVRRER